MTLILLLVVPFCAGLLCLVTRTRRSWEWLNLLAFGLLAPLVIQLGADVLAHGRVTALDGFLCADALSVLAGIAQKFEPTAMRRAFILVLLGYGTKPGLARMYPWKPDAYAEARVPTAALLGAAFINCAIYGLARFHVLAVKCLGPGFSGP